MSLKEIEGMTASLLLKAPFFGSLVMKCRFREDTKVQNAYAYTDGKETVYLTPLFFRLSPQERVAVIAHEVLHLAFRHKVRRGSRDPHVWNIATDCVINEMLIQNRFTIPEGAITARVIVSLTDYKYDESTIKQMSAEQIYEILVECGISDSIRGCGEMEHGPSGDEGEEGDGVNWDEIWKQRVAEAVTTAKMVGRLPAGEGLLIELLKPKVDWRTLLRQAIIQGPGLQKRQTWIRPNRRIPNDVPGYISLTVNNIWCLVDSSGSMVGKSLNQVMSEVNEITKKIGARVNMMSWDADVYEENVQQVLSRRRVRGGGGTVIMPALEALEKKMHPNDVIIVLSDGMIFDIDDVNVQSKLQKLARYASSAIFLTTLAKPRLPANWTVIKID